jgi:DNA-binding NarL/FixJ family response regulator
MNILIVEDHQLYINGLSQAIEDDLEGASIHSVSRYPEVISVLNSQVFDIVLLDINLNGVDMLKKYEEHIHDFSKTKILIISSYFSPDLVNKAKTLGANGFLSKNSSKEEIVYSINTILSDGGFVVSGNKIRDKLDNYDNFQELNSLSKREKEIIELLSKGFTNSKIAKELFISSNTVHTHRKNIYKKLKVSSVQELISLAYRYNLFTV